MIYHFCFYNIKLMEDFIINLKGCDYNGKNVSLMAADNDYVLELKKNGYWADKDSIHQKEWIKIKQYIEHIDNSPTLSKYVSYEGVNSYDEERNENSHFYQKKEKTKYNKKPIMSETKKINAWAMKKIDKINGSVYLEDFSKKLPAYEVSKKIVQNIGNCSNELYGGLRTCDDINVPNHGENSIKNFISGRLKIDENKILLLFKRVKEKLQNDNLNYCLIKYFETYDYGNSYDFDFVKIMLAWKFGIYVSPREHGADVRKMLQLLDSQEHNIKPIYTDILIPKKFSIYINQYFLLGLSKKSCILLIKNNDDKKTFEEFIKNPYKFYKIRINECDEAIKKIYSINNMDIFEKKQKGEISRKIYSDVVNNKWTATPMSEIEPEKLKLFKNVEQLREYFLIKNNDMLYIDECYWYEKIIIEHLQKNIYISQNNFDLSLHKLVDLTHEQVECISFCLNRKFSIITGGAGTGKTTVISRITNILKNKDILILALSNKAVRRIINIIPEGNIEYSNVKIRTIHSALLSDLSPDYIIVDECSMVSVELLAKIFSAWEESLYVLVGDNNQLPPIEYGRPFSDIIEKYPLCVRKLTKNLRMKNGKKCNIVENSIMMLNPKYEPDFRNNFKLANSTAENFIQNIKNSFLKNIKHTIFLCYTNEDCLTINKHLLDVINNGKNCSNITFGDKKIEMKIFEGNKIIFVENFYVRKHKTEVFYTKLEDDAINSDGDVYIKNSTSGIIQSIIFDKGTGEGECILNTEDGYDVKLFIKNQNIQSIYPGYCVTIHKSQGSEWPYVYFYLGKNKYINKNAIYTAITRASEECTVIGEIDNFRNMARKPMNDHYGGIKDGP